MSDLQGTSENTGASAGVLIATAVSLLALPSAVLAFSSRFEAQPANRLAGVQIAPLQAARVAAHLVSSVPVRSLARGQAFRFTPVDTAGRPDRSVTVAVRIDPATAQSILVLAPRARLAVSAVSAVPAALQLSPTGFNLGVSRGYRSFAQNLAPSPEIRKLDMPDLASFKKSPASVADAQSRFSPRIVLDARQAPGRAPRTFSGGEDQVDLGGSYRLSRNLNVTAGVRYSQDRDRLQPVTDGKKDSQAVYVGTQFRF
jgi:hypothetical protein